MENNEDKTGKDLFQEISDLELRKQTLRDNAYKSEVTSVTRKYTKEEITSFKETLSNDMVELNKDQEALKEYTDKVKAKMKPLQVRVKEATSAIRNGTRQSREEVFMLDDQAKGVMDIFDGEGKYLYSRRLAEDERQTNMLSMNNTKTGTNY